MMGLGTLTIAYLFLGGSGAGTLCVLASTMLFVPSSELAVYPSRPSRPKHSPPCRAAALARIAPLACRGRGAAPLLRIPGCYRTLFAPGLAVALVTLVLGCICLLLDLGNASRALLLFSAARPTFITFGTFALGIALAAALFLLFAWCFSPWHLSFGLLRAAEIVAALDGGAVMTYTGLLLGGIATVPLWSGVWVPLLFVLSSLSCGCAITLLAMGLNGSSRVFAILTKRLLTVDRLVIALEALAAGGFVIAALIGGKEVGAQGAWRLLTGDLALLFLGGFVIAGLALPFACESVLAHAAQTGRGRQREAYLLVTASVGVLVGACLMRHCVVAAGAHPFLGAL